MRRSGTCRELERQQSLFAEWTVVRSHRRTMELRVYPDGRVQIRAPRASSNKAIDEFVRARQAWLERKLRELREQQPRVVDPWQCRDGAELFFMGDACRLRLLTGSKAAWSEEADICLRLSEAGESRYLALLESFFRQEAGICFAGIIDRWFPAFAKKGCQRPRLRIKKMQSRWGSLSSRGYINLNLSLMHCSPQCIEYVVVHELCHLLHMNHGPRFKALQTRLLPDWKRREEELKRQTFRLASIF